MLLHDHKLKNKIIYLNLVIFVTHFEIRKNNIG